MFQHITILFSFIFAIAFTHLLASATALVLARRRVRFSVLHAAWMVVASGFLLYDWITLVQYSVTRWSIGEVMLQMSWVIPQYFTCSLLSIKVSEVGEVDMHAFFEEQRPAIFSAYIVLSVAILLETYLDRNNMGAGWTPNDWIGADLLTLPALLYSWIAGWAKSKRLQWMAACAALAQTFWFFWSFGGLVFDHAATSGSP